MKAKMTPEIQPVVRHEDKISKY